MYCPLLLYDIVYEYCLNDNYGLNKYYSSIATEIDDNDFNHIYNLTNNSYNHIIDDDNNAHINDSNTPPDFILDENNNPIPKTNAELLKTFDLKEVEETELTFFIYNYQMIYKKNKKVLHKELI